MLYVIQHGGNWVPEATDPENIIYLACSVIQIYKSGLNFYFSDGHATDNLTVFYNKEEIKNINRIVDWRAIKKSYWSGEENLDLKRKKQAEFLVKEDIPPEFIMGYGCFNEKAKEKLINFGIDEGLIKIIPEAYY